MGTGARSPAPVTRTGDRGRRAETDKDEDAGAPLILGAKLELRHYATEATPRSSFPGYWDVSLIQTQGHSQCRWRNPVDRRRDDNGGSGRDPRTQSSPRPRPHDCNRGRCSSVDGRAEVTAFRLVLAAERDRG
jgi:hypothetical protein